jgi:hypothetical protein
MKSLVHIMENTGKKLLPIIGIMLFILSSQMAIAQTITTDKVDYMPGDTMKVIGTGWQSNESVSLLLKELELLDPGWVDLSKTLICDGSGAFTDEFYIVVTANLGAFFHITATGLVSNHVATTTCNDAGGAYAIDWSAYNPSIYERKMPGGVIAPAGRGPSTLGATFHNATVESLMPEFLGLGQIVAFECWIRVDANSVCTNDNIQFTARFNTETSSGRNFGFDPGYTVLAAFVDTESGGGIIDIGGNATITSFNSTLGADYFDGQINVGGLDPGDEIPVEIWVVLDKIIPAGTNGNVPTTLRNAVTMGGTGTDCAAGDAISTGNQTVPLNQVGNFFSADVDISVIKDDQADPVSICGVIQYTLTVHNVGPTVANTIVVKDILDNNTIYNNDHSITDNLGTPDWVFVQSGQELTFSTGYLDIGETVTITYSVSVKNTAPRTGTGGAGGIGTCATGDIRNPVSITTVSDDILPSNNSYCEPTGIECETESPIISGCPTEPINRGCNPAILPDCEAVLALGITATDACFGAITPTCSAGTITEDGCSRAQVFTVKFTDECGNFSECEVTFNWTVDITPPTASNPAPITLTGCNGTFPAADITVVTDEDDNCGTPTVAFVSDGTPSVVGCTETTVRTYSVTDACGNQIQVTQNLIRTVDITPPTASNPAPITLTGCNGTFPAADITVVTDEDDNCGTPTVAFVSDGTPSVVGCTETTVRTYSVTDACGNQIQVTQNLIRTVDITPPTASNPAPITLTGCNGTFPAADITVVTDEDDNCGTPTVAFVSDGTPSVVGCTETTVRTYSVTDACGNQIQVTQNLIRTVDITPPTASNPAPITLTGCNGTFPAADITVVTDEDDNCGTPTVAFVSDGTPSVVGCTETTVRTYSVTDACGNQIQVTQNLIRTVDITPPTASNPAPITLTGCNGTFPAADITVVTDEDDNCGTPTVAFVSDGTPSVVGCTETTVRTYSVTDACGNQIQVTQNLIRTVDITPPTASNPAPITLTGCNGTFPAADITVVTDEDDNCGTPTVAFVSDGTPSVVGCTETTVRTYSVTDACGNQIQVTQNLIRTVDITPPTASNPAPITLTGCNGTFPAADITVVTDEDDNCGTPTVAFVSDGTPSVVGCTETTVRTYSVTDACGNQIQVTQNLIRTVDITPPTASNPAPITLTGCNGTFPAADITVVTDEDDNCGTPTVAFVSDGTPSVVGCTETTVRTYSVTDACGNQIQVTQNLIRTVDITPPTASNPAPITLTGCNGTFPAADITVVTDEDDNCGTPTVAFVSDGTPSVVGCTETTVRTYSVTDACGNQIQVTQNLIRTVDITPPTASNPAPITLTGCNGTFPAADITVVTDEDDNCGTPTVAFVSDGTPSVVGCTETTVRTYSVTDACGNQIQVTQNLIRTVDITPPTASNPAPITLTGCNGTFPAADITVVTDEDDNCGTPTVAFVSDGTPSVVGCTETTVRTYSVTDACGNQIQVTQNLIRTVDITPPTASNPAPITLTGCNGTFPAADITVVTDEDDNCGTPTVAFVSDGTPSVVGCTETTVRTYSVTDACGNQIQVTQNLIRTVDITPPTASNPAPITLTGCNGTFPAADITVVTDEDDNCGTPTVAFVSDGTPSVVGCTETTVRTYSVTDACGNQIQVTQNLIRTVDITPPTASNPAPITLTGCNGTFPAADITVVTDEDDNCGTPTVAFVSDGTPSVVGCTETTVRTYSVTDACGNQIQVTQNLIRTVDITPPTASNPAPITLTGCNGTFPAADITVVTDEDDNCGTPTVAFVSDGTPSVVGCTETTVRTYSVTDACGNQIQVTQNLIRTVDITPPTASNPAPITLTGCNGTFPAADITVVTDEDDNCGTPTVAFVSDGTPSVVGCTETTVRTYSVTDACGNQIQVTQNLIRTVDITPPTASNPAPITLTGCNGTFPAADITVVTDEDDNCGTPTVAFVSDGTPSVVGCTETTVRTYSVTDACGNQIQVTQNLIRTVDITPPTASNPAPITLTGCNGTFPAADITVVTDEDDNCGTPTVAFVSDGTPSVVGCTETTVRTYSVTDACGNQIQVTQNLIRTVDITPPTASNPAPITLTGCNGTFPAADITVVTDEDDNCGTPTVAFVSDGTPSVVGCTETTVRTYSVTDACGNQIQVTQNLIRTVDITPPTASNPAPITLTGCNGTFPAADITVVTDEDDNCGTPTVAFVSDGTPSVVGCTETTVRTYSVTDACGNQIQVTQNLIRTVDITPPTASNPAPITLTGCNGTFPAADITVVTDEDDNCGTPTVAFVSDGTPSVVGCTETTVRTYSVTDACGNQIQVTQNLIRTVDITPPTASNPAPITLTGCNGTFPAADITVVTDEDDNCGTPTVAFVSDGTPSVVGCTETTVRTYSVTDACGNQIQVTQNLIRTVDITPPTASNPAPITLTGCNGTFPAADITVVTDEDDNCGTPTVAFVSDGTPSVVGCTETTVRTYSVTDACGNQIQVTQNLIRTVDITPPTASNPAPITLTGCNGTFPAADITVVTDEDDNCGTPTVAFVSDGTPSVVGCTETTVRTYSVTDACGNQIQVTQNLIRTVDITPPTASNPAPITLTGCNGTFPAADITVVTDEDDNCGTPTVAFVSDGTPSVVGCTETTVRTYSVTDACGNQIQVTQNLIRTVDITPPTASNPAPITLTGCNGTFPAADITVVTDEDDNCGTPTVAFVSDGTPSVVGCTETTVRTYSVTDACGNQIQVTQNLIRTVDITPPTASNPAPITLTGCNGTFPAADITVVTDEDDNCGTPTVAFVSDGTPSVVGCTETTVRTYSVTDACGNQIQVTQNLIRTVDITPPTASNPAPITLTGCNGTFPAADITVVTDEDDNCGTPTVAFVSDGTPSVVGCTETTVRTYSVTDACGNQIQVTQNLIRTVDITPPTASNPAPITLTGCNGTFPAADITVVTDEDDNCGTPTVAFVSDGTPSVVGCTETTVRTYSVTDACGNQIQVTQNLIRTVDITPPTASNPAPITLTGCNGTFPAADITVVTDEDDNCGTPTVAFVSDGTPSVVGCTETTVRTYSVTDACGNQIQVTQNLIRTVDITPPTASNPAPITLTGCNGTFPAADITVVTDEDDNCGTPTVAFVSDGTPSVVGCTETTVRTYSVTDACGNQIQVTQNLIRTVDITPPTASNPAPITLTGCNGTFPAADITVVTDEDDNCGTPTVAFVSDGTPSVVGCTETTVRTYSVTDACGNQIQVTQNLIRTVDITPPTASNPAPITLTGCNGTFPAADITVVTDEDDNCGTPTVAFVSDGTPSVVGCTETTVRTYSVTDACGNQIQVTQNLIRTVDITPPTASNPAPITLTGCNGTFPAADITVVTDEDDNCGTPTVAFVSDGTPSVVGCTETTVRTYSVTDACGNQIQVTQNLIRTVDITPPTASNPAPITLTGCNGTFPAADITVVTDEDDNCGTPTVAFVSDGTPSVVGCTETTVRTYSVTDACGNQIQVTQNLIRTVDITPPTASNPAPITLTGCNGTFPAADITVVTDEDDNCGTPTVAFVSDGTPSVVGCTETTVRTYSVTDACGNQIQVTQNLIRTVDITPPTASNPAPITLTGCNGTFPAADITVVTDEDDNCGTPTVAFVSDGTPSVVGCTETTVRTYSVTDACGNQIQVTQNLIRTVDITPPTASNPAPITLTGCNGTFPAADITVVTDEDDNCGTPTVAFVSDGTPSVVGCTETTVRTYSVTDACGNQIQVTQNLIRTVDITPPIISTTSANIHLGCNPTIVPPVFTGKDNCEGDFTPVVTTDGAKSDGCLYTQTWTANYTDQCDNPATPVSITYTWYPEAITTDAGLDQIFPCGVETIQLIGSTNFCEGHYTTLWTTTDGTILSDPTQMSVTVGKASATYTLTVVSVNGLCTESDEVAVIIPPDLSCTVLITQLPNCDDLLGIAELTVTGGTAPFSITSYALLDPATPIIWMDLGAGKFQATGLLPNVGPYLVEITDAKGCKSSCNAIPPACQPPTKEFCTYTQGKYGNQNGQSCDLTGKTPDALFVANLLLKGDLVIGAGSNTITFTAGDASLIKDYLPGGRGSGIISGACMASDKSCMAKYLTKTGTIESGLITQTIALGLNLRIGSGLSEFELESGKYLTTQMRQSCEKGAPLVQMVCNPKFKNGILVGYEMTVDPYMYRTLNAGVLCYMANNGYDLTVGGLYKLANDALGGIKAFPATTKCGSTNYKVTVVHIADAVDAINNVFDECRYFVGYRSEKFSCLKAGEQLIPENSITDNMKVYPNPFNDKVTFEFVPATSASALLEVYNMLGEKIAVLLDRNVEQGIPVRIEYQPVNLTHGMIYYRLKLDGNIRIGKLTYIKNY